MSSYDNTGAGWNRGGGTGWNRDCVRDRSSWYSDMLNSFTCWSSSQPEFTGALAALVHGCSFRGGGTVGIAWLGVSFFFFLNLKLGSRSLVDKTPTNLVGGVRGRGVCQLIDSLIL